MLHKKGGKPTGKTRILTYQFDTIERSHNFRFYVDEMLKSVRMNDVDGSSWYARQVIRTLRTYGKYTGVWK